MTRLRPHLPSAIVATFILVVAMAASATAATLITSAQIKDNTVASVDIHDGTVKSVDLANGGVAGIDVKDSSIASVDIANGSVQPVDLSQSARLALVGAACTVPTYGAGTVQLIVGGSGAIAFKCVNAATTDHDGDEVSVADGDCNDSDAAVFPGAFEVFNGIDDDCDGALWTDVPFYTGPQGTENTGACHDGIKHEIQTSPFFVVDVDEVLPEQEVFDGIDNDCDGSLLNNVAFYTGPPGTAGVGACQPGTKNEVETDPFFVVVEPEVTPVPEIAGNEIDDNCDGVIDNA